MAQYNSWLVGLISVSPSKLTLCTPVSFSQVRMRATDPEMLSRYFDLLEETLTAK